MHRESVEDLESHESVLYETLVVDTFYHTFVRATEGPVLAGTTDAHCWLGVIVMSHWRTIHYTKCTVQARMLVMREVLLVSK